MTTQAKLIADSISPDGVRLTTVELEIHRMTLAEWNTHRVFSRNSASSRAIPLERTMARLADPNDRAWPVEWPCEQPGMSGGAELVREDLDDASNLLLEIQENTLRLLDEYVRDHPDKSTRLHKSWLNRPLEWFSWHTILVTATDWDNFFRQRLAKNAQPEFRVAAELLVPLFDNVPKQLNWNDWHLPYIDEREGIDLPIRQQLKVSAGRCARTSYLTHHGKRDASADVKLYDETLQKEGHWSPLEHQAKPEQRTSNWNSNPDPHVGNFARPWMQQRYFVENAIDGENWN